MAEKLIPGIPHATRIAFLQQTGTDGALEKTDIDFSGLTSDMTQLKISMQRSVIEDVIEKAVAKDGIQQQIDILSSAVHNTRDVYAPVRAIRQIRHERLKKQLFEMDKDARLRSGARGLQARKALVAFEETIAESAAKVDQEQDEITEADLKEESEAALNLLTELESQLDPMTLVDLKRKARAFLMGLGFPEAKLDKPVSTLSGGWNMRCRLAADLLMVSDILILDEPTNFLDLLGILWLQRYLLDLQENAKTTVVVVSHDRDFIDATCQEVIILRDQSLTYFRGNLSAFEEDVRSKKLYLGRMQEAQDRQKAHMEKTVRENVKVGKATGDDNKLRQAKSRQKKLDDRMGMEVSAKGTRFKLNRDLPGYHLASRAEIDIPADEKSVSIMLPAAPNLRFPGPLVSLENVTFKYPSSKTAVPVLRSIDLVVHPGDRVGIVGLNGCGKSTLIKLVTDATKPSTGTVSRHSRLRLGYYSQDSVENLQHQGNADPSLTALSLLGRDAQGELRESDIRGLLGSFGLQGRTTSDVPIAKLSGGQLVRLALAMILWKSPQLLVLDEITTHLDFYTIKALSHALSDWNGAILLVSHDRFMIRRVVEGEEDDDASGGNSAEKGEEEEKEEEEQKRRRSVYLLKGGRLALQGSGVRGFEQSLEKRVQALLASSS